MFFSRTIAPASPFDLNSDIVIMPSIICSIFMRQICGAMTMATPACTMFMPLYTTCQLFSTGSSKQISCSHPGLLHAYYILL